MRAFYWHYSMMSREKLTAAWTTVSRPELLKLGMREIEIDIGDSLVQRPTSSWCVGCDMLAQNLLKRLETLQQQAAWRALVHDYAGT
jgi:hypothetical protein